MESKELTTILSIFANVGTVVTFIFLVVPGFISLRVYETLRGGEGRKFNEVVVDVIMYSFATDVVVVAVLAGTWFLTTGWLKWIMLVAIAIVGLLVLPGFIASWWFRLQQHLAKSGILPDPIEKPWDKFFKRISEKQMDVGIIVTLTDGSRLGGRYCAPGFVSSSPADEQLHVGESWKIDRDTGEFLELIPGSYGFLIDKKDCSVIEFFDWTKVEATLKDERQISER